MDGNDLANPVKHSYGEEFFTAGGFTKRELIAAMAMQGLLASVGISEDQDSIAEWAVSQTDALIERLNADPAEGAKDDN